MAQFRREISVFIAESSSRVALHWDGTEMVGTLITWTILSGSLWCGRARRQQERTARHHHAS